MHILTKVGNQDNVVTYEHICDTLQDRDNIEKRYITLGSTCLVLSGENDTIEVYMADSNKEWHDIAVAGGSGGGSGSGDERGRAGGGQGDDGAGEGGGAQPRRRGGERGALHEGASGHG